MIKSFHEAIEDSIGYSYSSNSKRRKTPWWNDEVKTAVRTKTHEFREWMRNRTAEQRRKYEQSRNQSNNIKRKAKAEAWERLCADLENDLQGNRKLIFHLAKAYRKGNHDKCLNIKDSSTGEILTTPADIDKNWKGYFSTLLNPTCDQQAEPMSDVDTDTILVNDNITEDEVEEAIQRAKNGKSSGTDMITNDIYKWGRPITTSWLTRLFQRVYENGQVPEEWGKSIICPIYKNKGDRMKCENYRGISLMNHVTKIYESILEKRLRVFADEHLGPWQHGFRPHRSTKDMIFTLRRIMDKHWEFNQPLYIAFIDLEKAFDRVPRQKLWESLDIYNIPKPLKRAIMSLYKINHNRVSTGTGAELWFDTTSGVRQGSVLSPLLFIMYLDLVIKEVARGQPTTDILAYADDIAQLATKHEELQKLMTLWDKTLTNYGLKLNKNKTEILVLSRTNLTANIQLSDITLKQVRIFKYLGSTISENGLIDIEINHRINLLSQNVKMLYRLLKDKSVPKKVKAVIHTGILRPILLYGSDTWNINTTNMSKLNAADMRIVRIINGVTIMDKIRNVKLCDNLGIKPLNTIIKNSQIRWYGHIRRREDSHPTQLALNYKVEGKRPTGRPRKRWSQYIDDYLGEAGTSLKDCERGETWLDRDEWRNISVLTDKSNDLPGVR